MSSTPDDRVPSRDVWVSAFRAARMGFAAIGADERIMWSSSVLEAVLERSSDELIGARLTDYVEEADRDLDALLLASLRTGERTFYELERRYRSKGGRTVFVRELVSRAVWSGGIGRLVTMREVSESRRRTLAAQARDALVLLGESAAIVSHEVRNALAGIRSAVEVIGDALPPGGIEDVAVDEVRGRIVDLDRRVSELLAFARVPRLAPASARAVLDGVSMALVSCTLCVRGDDLLLRVDAPQIATALVEVCRGLAPRSTLDVSLEREGAWAVLRLRDASPRESRAASWNARQDRLGARLAQRVIEAHEGELSVEPDAMIVRLPVAADPDREAG